jgi:hypothetical protein
MSDTALNVAGVLWEERKALARPKPGDRPGGPKEAPTPSPSEKNNDPKPDDIADIYRNLNKDNHWALCLSGGGIRSAAFALGVIQRLAAQRVAPKAPGDEPGSALQQFEYLSTVSGGGYIGSWLSAWLFQERQKRGQGGADQVVEDLNRRIKDHAEVDAISNLRRDSHYLAPSFSAISPDLWSDIAGFTRNLCLNWILLVPPMILAVLATKAVFYGFLEAPNKNSSWFSGIMAAATVCFVVALSFSAANRPSRRLINASQPWFLIWDMAVFLFSAALLVFVLGSDAGRAALTGIVKLLGIPSDVGPGFLLIRGTALGLCIYLASWFVAWLWPFIMGERPQPEPELEPAAWHKSVDFVAWCVAGAAFGALIAAGYLVAELVNDVMVKTTSEYKYVAAVVCVCGLPWIVSARIIADVIFISFAKFIPGADAGLEYQARSGGILTLAQIGWLVWFALVLWTPIAEKWAAPWIANHLGAWLATVGTVSGAFAVITGASSKTAAIVRDASRLRKYLGLNTLAAVAAGIFAASATAGLSIVIDLLAVALGQSTDGRASWLFVWISTAVLLTLILVTSLVISVNRYSLHSIYRNRLVRAFLGASRNEKQREQSKNRFTDFDTFDSPLLHQLWSEGNPRGDDWKPLHVINAAVNLVSSKNLAWQERMAAPFTFSPLHCGSGSAIFSNGAYRHTDPSPDRGKPYGGPHGLTLGTAMAISGAAVSPNMGYNTSPGVAFLMALFNFRLGWWLANPRSENKYYWLSSPRFALRPFFKEMFGLTSETERWVYLSDGGHFENLGIYEMVRRRCHVIVVSDAGCDPDYTFDDLGNALRKIWIDLGVRIEMCGLDRLQKRFKERPTPAPQTPYWAVGHIKYGDTDGEGVDGWLLYLKAGLHGAEPVDVLSYAMSHPSFPHETTANQFFSESQFESYRALGFEIVSRAFEAGARCTATTAETADASAETGLTLDAVIRCLDAQLRAQPSPCNR